MTAVGKPVAGVTVALRMMQHLERDDGTPLPLDAAMQRFDVGNKWHDVMEYRPSLASLFPPVTTNGAGRFEIHGVGRERVARLFVSAPAIESRWVSIATRPTVVVPIPATGGGNSRGLFATYRSAFRLEKHFWSGGLGFGGLALGGDRWGEPVLPATFVQVVKPSRPIVGIVRDSQSGRPLSGVRVSSQPPPLGSWDRSDGRSEADVSDTTNVRGEFRLTGVPKRWNQVLAEPPDAIPHFNRSVPCNTGGDGTEAVNLEIRLYRGIAVTGRLLDHNGKPVHGEVSYYPLVDNPYIESFADGLSVGRTDERSRPQYPTCFAAGNGLFYIPVLPGPGILLARPNRQGTRRARFDEQMSWIQRGESRDESDPTVVPTFPEPISLAPYDAYKGINPPADAASLDVDLTVNAGHVVEGQVLDAGGRPLAGVTAYGTTHDRLPESGKFAARAMVPGKPRLLYFLQETKGLGGSCRVQDGERSPVTVRLDSCGSVRGLLADSNEKPMANAHFYVVYAEADGIPRVIFPGGVRVPTAADVARYKWLGQPGPPAVEHRWESTDEKGSFLVKGLIPKLAFRLVAQSPEGQEYPMTETSVAPGQTQDLGRLKLPVPQ